jgi:hypothetical protein
MKTPPITSKSVSKIESVLTKQSFLDQLRLKGSFLGAEEKI